jgi:hypothetical protein
MDHIKVPIAKELNFGMQPTNKLIGPTIGNFNGAKTKHMWLPRMDMYSMLSLVP